MSELISYKKIPVVEYQDGYFFFQFGKTDWEYDVSQNKQSKKRSLWDRIIGYDPNAPIKRTSFFDIVYEDETHFDCLIGFKDDSSGQFTYTKLLKKGCMIQDGVVIASKNSFMEASRSNDEEQLMMDIIEESSIINGATIMVEEKVEQGELKQKYKVSLTKERQLVVNGYHYIFVAAAYAPLFFFDGYEDFIQGGDFADGGMDGLL